jgi:adenylylsulfate kinase
MFRESKIRSIVKTVSWRFWASLTTVALVFLFVGQTAIALSVGGIEVLLKLALYFVHERMWNRIKFGKHEVKPFVVWLTGLPGAGKSTIGAELSRRIAKDGLKVEHLDGESIRHIFPEVGYTEHDIDFHVKRVGYLASKLEQHGIFVIASFMSPYASSRKFVRNLCNNFVEVYVSTPLEVCEKRDPNGLYSKARRGEIKNMTGIDAPYEQPSLPEITVDCSQMDPPTAAGRIYEHLVRYL